MKHHARIDPYALNPEKFLAADAKKNQTKSVSGSLVYHEIASKVAKGERIFGFVSGISGKTVMKKKPNPPPDATPPSGADHL
jgi:hypothetical protein